MSFDWSEYLKLAQELAGQAGNPASQEARLRAAVSRAYYAVFCMSRYGFRVTTLDAMSGMTLAHYRADTRTALHKWYSPKQQRRDKSCCKVK